MRMPSVSGKERGARSRRRLWFCALVVAICFEGIGRKFVPSLSQMTWYFLKDAVLILGLTAFGLGSHTVGWARRLYSGFGPVLAAAGAWTLMEVGNPGQASILLGVLGVRAYWLWWIAPLVVANALRDERDFRFAELTLGVVGIIAGIVAAIQFELPSDSPINQYAWKTDVSDIARVAATGRVRVTSTFSYLSGFADLTIVGVPLLLALGLSESRSRVGRVAVLGAAVLGMAAPMTGSRSAAILGSAGTLVVLWAAGFLATRRGRRLAITAAGIAAAVWFGSRTAVEGVQSRLGGEDTQGRLAEILEFLPPVALATYDYPFWGIGTGMQQNARIAMGIRPSWEAEGEQGRYLIELGPVGYLLVWLARLGLALALFRGASRLRRGGQRALSGAALVLGGLAIISDLAFDHVWQALFFVATGIVLRGVLAAEVPTRSSVAVLPTKYRALPAQ